MSYHRQSLGKFRGLAGIDDVLKDVIGTVGNVGGGVLDILGQPQQEAGRAQALLQTQQLLAAQNAMQPPSSGLTNLLPFLAIGGGVLLIVLLMKKKPGSAS